ncbi:MAG TPA: peptide MFS transporter [Saprospiraceae bacterium]|nr:peptide MFS transporter [Saprospiraceae bacterium]MCB9328097.1 peptide MFS transporter [Lewinellaceae bacterium]HPK09284.1 peptide MFS transporter [Saprospiraceae bacterium]HPQ20951.1 peptide MFS transporter [Saprospiraceae bacterium]
MNQKAHSDFFDTKVLGHPAGLFVLFFTEMWERFSYYGMRALLVLFLVSALGIGGWDWPREQALSLYGTYTALVYLTPILGGYLADRYLGYRNAVVIGALIMTLGHASMALEFSHIFLYIGIGLLIIGNGFFKPNMTSVISEMYKEHPEKKDGAYTIFYMGVNAGAFLGIMLCGYLGEKVGWSYGFGLAGIFMFLGMLQFYFAQPLFGKIGLKPADTSGNNEAKLEFEGDKFNPFSTSDLVIIAIVTLMGLIWIINDPVSKIAGTNLLEINGNDFSGTWIIVALILFLLLLVKRILGYPTVTRDRMLAIVIFCVFTVLFWASFEQAGGSMTIFAKDYTNRIMEGAYANIFLVVNILITVVPVLIITYVLYRLIQQTYGRILLSNVILATSFVIIWGLIFWMVNRDLKSTSYIVDYQVKKETNIGENGEKSIKEVPLLISDQMVSNADLGTQSTKIIEPIELKVNDKVHLIDLDKKGNFSYINEEKLQKILDADKLNNKKTSIVQATVVKIQSNEIEIPATWFLILNSLFIIVFAPLFSKWWESKYNPSASAKYGFGLILLGIGFGALAFGSLGIEQGAKVASVSLIWLVLAYLFHTLGELCLSPVSLSYISKLVPGRMIAMMFGIYYIAIAIGNKLAGKMGEKIDVIVSQYDMTTFFLIFTLIPIGFGVIAILLSPLVKKLMHGVK